MVDAEAFVVDVPPAGFVVEVPPAFVVDVPAAAVVEVVEVDVDGVDETVTLLLPQATNANPANAIAVTVHAAPRCLDLPVMIPSSLGERPASIPST